MLKKDSIIEEEGEFFGMLLDSNSVSQDAVKIASTTSSLARRKTQKLTRTTELNSN